MFIRATATARHTLHVRSSSQPKIFLTMPSGSSAKSSTIITEKSVYRSSEKAHPELIPGVAGFPEKVAKMNHIPANVMDILLGMNQHCWKWLWFERWFRSLPWSMQPRIGRLSPCAMMDHCGFIMAHGRGLRVYRRLHIGIAF
jgi:hypothetical protein